MEVFQGNSHIGIVVLFDFGDGEGYRLGVLQSTSTGKFKSYSTTCFENDKNAGPNITPLTPDNFNKKWNMSEHQVLILKQRFSLIQGTSSIYGRIRKAKLNDTEFYERMCQVEEAMVVISFNTYSFKERCLCGV